MKEETRGNTVGKFIGKPGQPVNMPRLYTEDEVRKVLKAEYDEWYLKSRTSDSPIHKTASHVAVVALRSVSKALGISLDKD